MGKNRIAIVCVHSFEKTKAANSSFGDFHVFTLVMEFHAPVLWKKWLRLQFYVLFNANINYWILVRPSASFLKRKTLWACNNLTSKQPSCKLSPPHDRRTISKRYKAYFFLGKSHEWGKSCKDERLRKQLQVYEAYETGLWCSDVMLTSLGRPAFVWINRRVFSVGCQSLTPDRNQMRTFICSNTITDKTSHAAKSWYFLCPFIGAHKS